MSSCISGSGSGRAYQLDLEIVKSASPSTLRSSHSSSPSSTLSESINSPLSISTRKPRTPRKRPNQTYTEAAALLSTVYPNIFSTKNLTKICKHTKPYESFSESSELLPPFPALDNAGFLLHQSIPETPALRIEAKLDSSGEKFCRNPTRNVFRPSSPGGFDGYEEDFDAESILDEEIEEGIDCIMGNLSVNNDSFKDSNGYHGLINDYYGNPMGYGFGGKFGYGSGYGGNRMALRHVEDCDCFRFRTVDIVDISPKFKICEKKKKKKKKVVERELRDFGPSDEDLKAGLGLKLNYEEVLKEWSDRGSLFSDEIPGSPESSRDAIAKITRLDLLSELENLGQQRDENGGLREASVLRYKEKRRNRLFSKKIRYQVRKVNADRRPRMKGRFVRRSGPSTLRIQ
eukprot:TRINITY_DN3947_c0_g1_i1.p1 TRINITY_DN3947_c0_g1~~TRINITY_DN3947_c0_g1_i1.p1  ORF type:complete len:402 (+),score=61.26 TRINITY_DN3947_c0_g1_i1:1021-2226(+)